ncbi:MAG: hypothetical protein JW840_04590 [Candidatus Thermoplasmatota archaeon]|nr:hypothetical protein [Candidatus Thermoplasmatota archaeon]
MKKKRYLRVGFFLILFLLITSFAYAQNQVIIDFYYSETCGSCRPAVAAIDNITTYYAENYTGKIIINKKEVSSNTTNLNEMRARKLSYPSVIINNETKIPKANITYTELKEIIDGYIASLNIHRTYDENIIDIPFFGTVNTTSLSLPVLTIVLAGLDSFNPCSFFILIFLLNLLVYLQSRRRMLLVGGVFIFFSALLYFVFMFLMFNTLLISASFISVISLAVGVVAVSIGLFNMKDFFFFRKGPSMSIPEEKQSALFKKIRNLVKSPTLVTMIGATIFLAVSVNFYELLCTFGFPMIYTARLTEANLPILGYYTYLLFYNIIYIIPLFIILALVTGTLGKIKLTEQQGRQLKLLSGIMIFSFGVLFLFDYTILENVVTPVALLGLSILLTLTISLLWKRYESKKEKQHVSQPDTQNKL